MSIPPPAERGDWRITVEGPASSEEWLLGAMSAAGFDEVEIRSPSSAPVVRVSAYWPAEAGPTPTVDLAMVPGAARLDDVWIPRSDWAGGWAAVEVPPFWIAPADQRHIAPPPGALPIYIQPGLGFGIGDHPSTRVALTAVAALARPVGPRVLDVGCGTGVLTLAALHVGARSAVAFDHEAGARAAASENAALNQRCLTVVDTWPHRAAELVIANITPATLIALAGPMKAHVTSGGRLILAGVRRSNVDRVLDAYAPFRFEDQQEEEGWLAVTVRNPTASL